MFPILLTLAKQELVAGPPLRSCKADGPGQGKLKSPGNLRDKDDFSRAGGFERARIPASGHVTGRQSRTGDQGLYVFSRWKAQRAARGQRSVQKAAGSLERDDFTVPSDPAF